MSDERIQGPKMGSSVWKTVKRVAVGIVILCIVAFVTILSIENQTPLSVRLWIYETPTYPFVVWLIAPFIIGVLVGALIGLNSYLRERARHRQDVKALKTQEASVPEVSS